MRTLRETLVWTATIVVITSCISSAAIAQCDCPFQGDANGDGNIDSSDRRAVGYPILGYGYPLLQDPNCPTSRADVNADGFLDISDFVLFWEVAFGYGKSFVDPCNCGFPCPVPPGTVTGTVVVESKSVAVGMQDSIGVFLSNNTYLDGLMIPLVVREIDIYPSDLQLVIRSDSRLAAEFPSGYTDLAVYDLLDGDCGGGPGTGFGKPIFVDFPIPDLPVSLPGSSPDGFRFYRVQLFPQDSLPPGSDGAIPSFQVMFTAPTTTGSFEIDTSCNALDNHLLFVETETGARLVPHFTKGTVTIGCDCPFRSDFDGNTFLDSVDLNAMIQALYFNGPDVQDPVCPITRADYTADGLADATDLNALIAHLFFNGPPPVDPCAP